MGKRKATGEERLLNKLIQPTLFGFSNEACGRVLEELITTYRDSMFAYAYELSRNYDAADDILQRAWLELYVELSLNGETGIYASNIPAWLRTIICHTGINYLKAQRRIVSLEASEGMWLLEPRVSPFERPDIVAARKETSEEMSKTLSSLPRNQQKVIYLHFSVGLKLEEIAQELNMPLSTVKSHLRRGLRKLGKLLSKKDIQSQELQFWEGYNDKQSAELIVPQASSILAEIA